MLIIMTKLVIFIAATQTAVNEKIITDRRSGRGGIRLREEVPHGVAGGEGSASSPGVVASDGGNGSQR